MIKKGETYIGTFNSNISGSAYFVNNELSTDIFINKNKTNKALHLDTVKIQIIKGNNNILEGEVIEIITRFKDEFVGTIQISPKHAFFIPDSNKINVDFFIPLNKTLDAKDGQKVVVKLVNWKEDAKSPNGEVIKVIGNAGEHETEIHSILEAYSLPYDFDKNIIDEAESILEEISQAEINKRRDMRNILTFTIDPLDAKDFDDALSVEWIDGELFVGVHIADVSHYLQPNTKLDKEAYSRGTSIYLVDRCIPMLPERLSNGLCSLRPNEDKLCFSVIFKLDHKGRIIDEWFGKTIINSNKRFTYEEAQAIIEEPFPVKETGVKKNDLNNELFNAIKTLNNLAKKMKKERLSKGSISFDKQEVKFKLDKDNNPIDIILKVNKDSNNLVEEFMLLANRRVAKLLNDNKITIVNRTHDKPKEEKLNSLKSFITPLGYNIATTNPMEITKTLNKLLVDIQGKPEANMVENLVVRTMQKADYRTINIGHYGLGFKDYVHFTSPIRRYPDLIIHRILSRYLDKISNLTTDELETKCSYLSERENKAQKAEYDSIKYMQCKYLKDKIGKVYQGVVSSIIEYGMFVTINENNCSGLVKLSDMGGDIYIANVNNYCVTGINTENKISLGDEVRVIIKSVDVERKMINLTLLNL